MTSDDRDPYGRIKSTKHIKNGYNYNEYFQKQVASTLLSHVLHKRKYKYHIIQLAFTLTNPKSGGKTY